MRWLALPVNKPAITSVLYSGSCLSATLLNSVEPIPENAEFGQHFRAKKTVVRRKHGIDEKQLHHQEEFVLICT